MPKGIVIPADPFAPMTVRSFDGLAGYQKVVDGLIEAVQLTEPVGATLFVDEEGRFKRSPFNPRATYIAMVHNPDLMFSGCMIIGDAVLVGDPDEEGETQDVPKQLIDLLLHTKKYRVEAQVSQDSDDWNDYRRHYPDMLDAYDCAITLAHSWHAVKRARVVPS